MPLRGWRPYEDWSSSPGSTTEPYLTDDLIRIISLHSNAPDGLSASEGIKKLRSILTEPKGAIRLIGLSGVGKTRLIQALFDSSVGTDALDPHLAVYTDLADSPLPSPLDLLEHLQHLNHPKQGYVLIIDNCSIDLHRKLCARMHNSTGTASIITVEYDISDDVPEHTDTYKLEAASDELIEKIVARRHPNLVMTEVRTIAAFSEGNSRIALALAHTAQAGGSLANLKDNGLIKRLFLQNHKEDPSLLRAAKALSLVYSFDGETLSGDDAELPRIATLAGQSVKELHGHIAELFRRQLIQKRSKWRALLPQALAHKLAKEALQDFPFEHVQECFVDGAPERLLTSFSRRIGCLHESAEAQNIVNRWLRDGGRLSKIEDLGELDSVLLDNVAPANPDAVVEAIHGAVTRGRLGFAEKRHLERVVGLLRSLAYEPDKFDRALTLILLLTLEAPNSDNTSAAIKAFKSLFHLHLSGTHATAKQRADFLRRLAAGSSTHRKNLVLTGLKSMLKCSDFISYYGFEFGTHKRDYGFRPKNSDEIQDWYRETFSLAVDLAERSYLRTPVRTMVADRFRWLADHTRLTDDLIALAERFAADEGWPEGYAGVQAAHASAKQKGLTAAAEKLEALEQRLHPNTLDARILCYLLPERGSPLDSDATDIKDGKRHEKAQQKAMEVCEGISQELAVDLPALKRNLPAMIASTSRHILTVAETIGRRSKEPRKVWELILAAILAPAHGDKTPLFPGAFLKGLACIDNALCNTLLDEALAGPHLHRFFIPMQTQAGVDHVGCKRLTEAAKHETVPAHTFRFLCGGGAFDKLSGSDFKTLVLAIAQHDGGLETALEIFHMRLPIKGADGRVLEIEEQNAGKALLGLVVFEEKKHAEACVLAEIVRTCLTSPTDDVLADQICERLLNGIAQPQVASSDYRELVAELGAIFPRSVLNILVEKAALVLKGRRNIFRDFRERSGCALHTIPDDTLLEWAHERPATRFLQLSEVVQVWQQTGRARSDDSDVDEDPVVPIQWTSTALRVLHEAPDPLAVLNRYVRRFHFASGSGSLARILATRLPLLKSLAQDADPKIANAAAEAVGSFNKEVERRREWEYQHSRDHHERFEW